MFRNDNYLLNFIAAILFGTGGISAGFWFTADIFFVPCVAGCIGLICGLLYLCYLFLPDS